MRNESEVYVHGLSSFPWKLCRLPCEKRHVSLRNYSIASAHSDNAFRLLENFLGFTAPPCSSVILLFDDSRRIGQNIMGPREILGLLSLVLVLWVLLFGQGVGLGGGPAS